MTTTTDDGWHTLNLYYYMIPPFFGSVMLLFSTLDNSISISQWRSLALQSTVSSLSFPLYFHWMLPVWTLVRPSTKIDTPLCVGQNPFPMYFFKYLNKTLSFVPVMLSAQHILPLTLAWWWPRLAFPLQQQMSHCKIYTDDLRPRMHFQMCRRELIRLFVVPCQPMIKCCWKTYH